MTIIKIMFGMIIILVMIHNGVSVDDIIWGPLLSMIFLGFPINLKNMFGGNKGDFNISVS